MSERKRVKLTLAQADAVDWALGPMGDYWCTEDGAYGRDGTVYPETDLPFLGPCPGVRGPQKTARLLTLSPVEEINSDLLYRLEVQLQDMAGEEATPKSAGDAKAAWNVGRRIRHLCPSLREMPTGGL